MTSWLEEVLHGVRKRDDRGVELRNIQISELSGVDDPASGFPDWLLMKSARAAGAERESEFPGLKSMSTEELLRLQQLCQGEPEMVEKALARRTGSWSQRLAAGHTIRFE